MLLRTRVKPTSPIISTQNINIYLIFVNFGTPPHRVVEVGSLLARAKMAIKISQKAKSA